MGGYLNGEEEPCRADWRAPSAKFPERRRQPSAPPALPAIITRRGSAADNPTVVNSIRSLSNPYHATWNKGGAAFAKSVGAEYVTLVDRRQLREGHRRHQGDPRQDRRVRVINVDPNDSPDARPIVEAARPRAPMSSRQWNKPADLHPWDFDPNYVAHISFSGVPYGKRWPRH